MTTGDQSHGSVHDCLQSLNRRSLRPSDGEEDRRPILKNWCDEGFIGKTKSLLITPILSSDGLHELHAFVALHFVVVEVRSRSEEIGDSETEPLRFPINRNENSIQLYFRVTICLSGIWGEESNARFFRSDLKLVFLSPLGNVSKVVSKFPA